MFAGPNGSGKTTIKNGLNKSERWFGIYFNPDEIEKSIRDNGFVSVERFSLEIDPEELRNFFANSILLQLQNLHTSSKLIRIEEGKIYFPSEEMNSYFASVLTDFLRRTALTENKSFSFETVMSAPDKVELLDEAQQKGYRTYLYFVATEAPEINVSRIGVRVTSGGHSVPADKVIARYHRSLALLPDAIRCADRAYIFDTSKSEPWLFAEITDGHLLELKSQNVPNWFRPIWKEF
jgi:predicted ABC-type ATPase